MENKTTTTAAPATLSADEAGLDEILNQPAQITHEELVTIETAAAAALNVGSTRRGALASLTVSIPDLVKHTSEREGAEAFSELADCARSYVGALRRMADLMDTAALRIEVAIAASRDDADELIAESGFKPRTA